MASLKEEVVSTFIYTVKRRNAHVKLINVNRLLSLYDFIIIIFQVYMNLEIGSIDIYKDYTQ